MIANSAAAWQGGCDRFENRNLVNPGAVTYEADTELKYINTTICVNITILQALWKGEKWVLSASG